MRVLLSSLTIILLAVIGSAEIYQVPDFRGGMNVVFDSTNLAPNEFVLMKNFTLDQPNVATSRHGYSVLNANAIDTSRVIDNIFIYEPYPDTFRLIVASGGYIYICPSISAAKTVDWDTLKLRQEASNLHVVNGGDSVISVTDDVWWLAWVSAGDAITIDDDSSSTVYEIDTSSAIGTRADTVLPITPSYVGANDGATDYTIYKKYRGRVRFTSNDGLLYITDSDNYAVVYDDTNWHFVSLVDTGVVVDTFLAPDSIYAYAGAGPRLRYGSYNVYISDFPDTGLDVSDMMFCYTGEASSAPNTQLEEGGRISRGDGRSGSEWIDIQWCSPIIGYEYTDAARGDLTLADVWPYGNDSPDEWVITYAPSSCNNISPYGVIDTTKSWLDIVYGKQFLAEFLLMYSNRGAGGVARISCNADTVFYIDTSSVAADRLPVNDQRYYIFSKVPVRHDQAFTPTDQMMPFYEQVLFNRGKLLAFGSRIEGGRWAGVYWKPGFSSTIDAVWYSDNNMPFFMRDMQTFYVDGNITAMFELVTGVYIATNHAIWRVQGNLTTASDFGDQYSVKQIVTNIGIGEYDYFAKSTNDNIYFVDETGLYRFNGIRAERISYKIGPLIEEYFQKSEARLLYFDNKVYVSFPDTSVQEMIVYDELWNAFYLFDFSASCFNHQSSDIDTTIFFFGNPEQKGYICFYPNSVYYDSLIGSTANYTCELMTGRQAFGGIYKNGSTLKSLNTIILPIQFAGITKVYTYASQKYMDFSAPVDSFISATPGDFLYIDVPNDECWGEYFQFHVKSSAGQKVIVRPIQVEYEWQPSLPK